MAFMASSPLAQKNMSCQEFLQSILFYALVPPDKKHYNIMLSYSAVMVFFFQYCGNSSNRPSLSLIIYWFVVICHLMLKLLNRKNVS